MGGLFIVAAAAGGYGGFRDRNWSALAGAACTGRYSFIGVFDDLSKLVANRSLGLKLAIN